MAGTFKTEFRGARLEGDRYLALLAIVLLGYAVMGKGFAYLGFPPLYVGEIAFLSGIIVFLRTGAFIGALATLPAVLLVALAALVLTRTLPFLGLYGFECLRDSTVVIYGGFAFIVIGLLLEDARRINIVLRHYRIMLTSLPAIFVALLLTKYLVDNIPQLIGTVPIVNTGPTTVGSHLVGTMIFALIGYRKVSVAWVVVWLAALGIVCATSRGAMLSVVLPIAFAMLMLGRLRLMLHAVGAGLAIFAALFTLESSLGYYTEAKDSWDRPFSAHQIVENAMSTFGQSGNQGEGTKQWREKWWHIIIQDSIHGPNFWSGRGFGPNIAEEDGFGGNTEDRAPLRSPHNVFMTLLARTGVPGLVLWVLVLVSWFGMMMKAILNARARGHKQWSDLFLFIACYAAAIVINATFDVVLEGPVQGIWFWCLFGFGVGSVMIYRAQPFTCGDCSAPQGTQVAPSPTDLGLPL
jgi:O-Antigen ligase